MQTSATLEGVELAERQRRVLRRQPDRLVRALLQLGLRAARRQAGRRAARRRGRALRLQRGPGLSGRRRSTIPAAGEIGDDLAVGSTAIGQGKVLATPLRDGARRGGIGERRPARPSRRCCAGERTGRTAAPRRRTSRADRPLHARRGHRRHRRRRGDPRRQGGGQDRHRRAALRRQRGSARPRTRRSRLRSSDIDRHRRLVRRLRAGRPPADRRRACCWSARAPAARSPRRAAARGRSSGRPDAARRRGRTCRSVGRMPGAFADASARAGGSGGESVLILKSSSSALDRSPGRRPVAQRERRLRAGRRSARRRTGWPPRRAATGR